MPQVTVLMTTYNGKDFLPATLQSIQQQSMRDWELLVMDDASTDGTIELLNDAANADGRIKVHGHKDRAGSAQRWREGRERATGKYLALIDQDDIALPGRLAEQTAFLDRNPGVGLCGTWIQTFGDISEIWRYPVGSDDIECRLVFESTFAEPSVMIRAGMLSENNLTYDPAFDLVHDYHLWIRAARHFPMRNLPRVLTKYRVHERQASSVFEEKLRAQRAKVYALLLADLGISALPQEIALHDRIADRDVVNRAFVEEAELWLKRLIAANAATSRYNRSAFACAVADYWLNVCRRADQSQGWRLRRFAASPLARSISLSRDRIWRGFTRYILKRPERPA